MLQLHKINIFVMYHICLVPLRSLQLYLHLVAKATIFINYITSTREPLNRGARVHVFYYNNCCVLYIIFFTATTTLL